ncbi:carnosine N-methyltransferase family protein [Oligoflexaceae bacterium]|nr:carnosine N-methyltransferase family protein [Oligoflexaceae bacterium]
MKLSSDLVELLISPKDGSALSVGESLLRDASGQNFPVTSNIPWVFESPDATLSDWKNRFDHQCGQLLKSVEEIKYFQRDRLSLDATKKRVSQKLQALVEQEKALKKLLSPLNVEYSEHTFIHETVGTKVPQQQSLMSYYSNAFRDWAWGAVENKQSLDIVGRCIPDDVAKGKILTLGAGSGRLSSDIHAALSPKLSVLSDINPFLAFVGQKMMLGKSIGLYEFPIAPKSVKDVSVLQKLQSPHGKQDNIHYVFCDGLEPPFKSEAFDCVITPWFVDIVPMDFAKLRAKINRILKPGGVWVNFGSLVFTHADPFLCYGVEEVEELVTSDGFEWLQSGREDVAYLHSPHSAQQRDENIFYFSARKTADSKVSSEKYNFLPEWISGDNVTIPPIPPLENLIMMNFLFAELLSSIHQGSTIQSLGEALAPQLKLPVDQSKEIVRSLLTKVYEEHLYKRNF